MTRQQIDEDPYPTDIFPEIPQEQYLQIHEMLLEKFGFPIDRLAAHIGRKLREPLNRLKTMTLIELMKQGNPLCSIPTGARVRKVMAEKGDHHEILHEGIVVGNLFEPSLGEAYLVHFDGDPDTTLSFIIGKKIQSI